jgi:hypothetical protein
VSQPETSIAKLDREVRAKCEGEGFGECGGSGWQRGGALGG